MTDANIKRLIYLCEGLEKDLETMKDELLIAMIEEQEQYLKTHDRTNYHYHPIK